MRAAKAELLKQAKADGQPRFEPADVSAFLASIDCMPESTLSLQSKLCNSGIAVLCR